MMAAPGRHSTSMAGDLGVPPEQAMQNLLAQYADKAVGTECSFAEFKRLWVAAGLSNLHLRCPDDTGANYLQGMFSSALVYTAEDWDIYRRIGAAFLLYCLHGSQPEQPPRPIRLVRELWDPMLKLRQSVRRHSADAFSVLVRMQEQGSFEYCVVASAGPGTSAGDIAAQAAGLQYRDIQTIYGRLEISPRYIDLGAWNDGMDKYRTAKHDVADAARREIGGEGTGDGRTPSAASAAKKTERTMGLLSYADMEMDTKVRRMLREHDDRLAAGPPTGTTDDGCSAAGVERRRHAPVAGDEPRPRQRQRRAAPDGRRSGASQNGDEERQEKGGTTAASSLPPEFVDVSSLLE
jgi:hypothetical protein